MSGTPRGSGIAALVAVAIVAAIAVVYAPVLGHEFVAYDDDIYVYSNPRVRAGLHGSGVVWALTSLEASNWHPLTWISHMLDVSWYGLDPAGHHATSVALHALSAVLVFLLFRSLLTALWRPALIAGLFALHPLRVESVAWIAERKDVLSGCLALGVITIWVRWIRRPRVATYGAALTLFVLGLAAKPMLVTLPFVLLLLDYWPLGRATRGGHDSSDPVPMSRRVLEKLPLFGLAALASCITWVAQSRGPAMSTLDFVPLGARVANAFLAYATYLAQSVWPEGLACLYPHPWAVRPAQLLWQGAGAALFVAVITGLAVAGRRRYPWLAVGWLWFVGMLVPVIGLVQVGAQAHADRYTYLPQVGLWIVVAQAASLVTQWRPALRPACASVAVIALVGLALASRQQVSNWRSTRTLFEHAITVTGPNPVAHNNLGNALLRASDIDGAIAEYEQALTLRPGYPEALQNLAVALERRGDLEGAILRYRQALVHRPDYPEAHHHLGLALQRTGDLAQAEAHLQQAITLRPSYAEALVNLGALLERAGRLDEAGAAIERALTQAPDLAEAHHNLGIVAQRQQRLAEAEASFRKALAIRPTYANARVSLALTLIRLGRPADAVAELERAVADDPHHPQAALYLERLRAGLREPRRPRPAPE